MLKTKTFRNYPKKSAPVPSLIKVQLDSYEWFLRDGLKELLEDFSPVRDYSGKKLELSFIDYSVEAPERTEREAQKNNLTFEGVLRVKVRLTNKETGEIKEQEVYLGELPLITKRGTFIINGVERAVVSQLIRSPGAYFSAEVKKQGTFFRAEIIPSRGAWLEFETHTDGAIYVKVDRRRKLPATALARAMGVKTTEELNKKFKDVPKAGASYIENTLYVDGTKTPGEALVEIYKRLRPGEMATEDNAKDLFKAMFSFERYDMERVGRWKLNQRLGLLRKEVSAITRDDRIVQLDDVIATIKEIIRLNIDPAGRSDDIDHLGNRRVRPVGILLQDRLRVSLNRMERIIKDRMSTLDIATLAPGQLIHANPFISAIQEFFGSSRLSQFMDQINPLAELEHKRRLSAKGPGGLSQERAGFEVRDVHTSHYGRLCPIQTPEGPNIGLVVHLAIFSRINENGFLETPYFKVKNGKVTDEIVYLNAFDEQIAKIAHGGLTLNDDGSFENEEVEGRFHGTATTFPAKEVEYRDIAPQQTISVATALIPFLEHDDANRALMGSNMQRQAVPCIKPEAPIVSTGMEEAAAKDSGYAVVAEQSGIVAEADGRHIVVKDDKGKKIKYELINFVRSNQYSSLHQKPIVMPGDTIKKGQVIADGPAIDNGVLALGQNLLVAFMSWYGFNYEDAIVISERLVKNDTFSSIHIEDFTIDVRDTKLGPEITTYDIPNVSESKLSNLDEHGIIRPGAEVKEGDILVGKISPKGETDLTGEERLLRAVFGEKARDVRDTSLVVPHGKRGRVIGVKVFSREKGDRLQAGVIKSIQVEIARLRKISVGDKLAGRHGNKGVISRILPLEDMPHLADGRPVDIVLNPLGVASRMNIGQILEMHLGYAAQTQDYRAITPALAGATEEEIGEELERAGLPRSGKTILFDGLTGEPFDQEVAVGVIYMLKLNHLVEDKVHARSIGPYSLTTQQPLGGKAQFGGQRFGEMEVWALEGYGAAHTLQEMLTIKSDDVSGRARAYESITKSEPIRKPNVPASFNVLLSEMKGLGFNPEMLGAKMVDEDKNDE